MGFTARVFATPITRKGMTLGDIVVLISVAVLIYFGVRLAAGSPALVQGPHISLEPAALPRYAGYSVARMLAAYALSLVFMLGYGYAAAYNLQARPLLLPLLDVLQSIPILSFLPVVLLSLSAILPQGIAVELASVVLIFTSQAWNLTFAWYQSLTTIPKELREASSIFHFNRWFRLKYMELPFSAISLIWNSMMSWAGGWFFLMAAEIFTVGQKDFRLPGLGAYLQAAASEGNTQAIIWGLAVLVLVIVLLDQFFWRPLLAWSDRMRIEMVESQNPPTSWFYDALRGSKLVNWLGERVFGRLAAGLDGLTLRWFPHKPRKKTRANPNASPNVLVWLAAGAALAVGVFLIGKMLATLSLLEWAQIGLGLGASLLRVAAAIAIALAWTIPVGALIGTNRKLSGWLQPLVQIVASIPATALFPVLLLFLLQLRGGINIAAVLLMLLGTQWYLLFNIIAGASAIPQDLKYSTALLQLRGWKRWRYLILPALFPYIVTGGITASGGAWNASIVAEYVHFSGKTYQTIGIGSTIAQATASGNYALLLGATLIMILAVVLINRLLWQRLYHAAENRYRME